MTSHSQKLDLTTFFLSIASAAYMGLKPEGGAAPDLILAKQNIDLLELMLEKTANNRTEDEDKLIQNLLFELRIHFVEAQKK